MKPTHILCTVIIGTCIAVSSAKGALYTLSNGDFETPVLPAGQQAYTGTPALPGFGWQVASGDIDVIRTLWQPASGAQSIDLNGFTAGTIYQDFSFSAGGHWAVMFAMSANPDSPATKSMNISFGPSGGPMTSLGNYSLAPGTRTYANMQWITLTTPSVNVQDSVVYRLQFTSLNPASNFGPALDNVQLVQVPEPSTLSLLGTGLILVFRWARKKNSL
jgi:hypothetical protein